MLESKRRSTAKLRRILPLLALVSFWNVSIPKDCAVGLKQASRPLKVLLAENLKAIEDLKRSLESVGQLAEKDDDIVLLRYLLEFKDVQKAQDAYVKGQEIRKAHAHVLKMARENKPLPAAYKFQGTLPSGLWEKFDSKKGTLWINRVGFFHKSMTEHHLQKDLLEHILYHKERTFMLLDKLTRSSGYLVKGYTILDFQGLNFFAKQPAAAVEASKISTALYPFTNQKTIMVNLPSFFNALWAICKPLLPEKVLEKIVICAGEHSRSSEPGAIKSDPVLHELWPDGKGVPDFLGGSCPVPTTSVLSVETGSQVSHSRLQDRLVLCIGLFGLFCMVLVVYKIARAGRSWLARCRR
eukprot:TRINITY_DN40096_c0_g1_i1.p1 TRINITY_DN40096_c0_g1~~TRINITY_DN40096_c0_g1_i1.p1  ORF type:complete len:354 (-),score=47.61 TRINITY_DN40096_c0_g1_i1:23-1084(-)